MTNVDAEDRHMLNVALGYPDYPREVYAVSRTNSAAIWWSFEGDLENITGWKVLRFRRSSFKKGDQWSYKGTTLFEALERTQVVIEELMDNFEYQFTVCAINEKGTSPESKPTNPVMIEKSLPVGWYRFYDDEKQRHYYANLRTAKSMWIRPETHPYFLEVRELYTTVHI